MSTGNKPGLPHEGENHSKPLLTVNVCLQALRQLVGIAFLVWSILAGGALLRWLLFGERNGGAYDLAQAVLGGLVAVLLWFIWRHIAQEDREHIVRTLAQWALAIALALSIKIYWPGN